jgi:prepilin-type N-terminal cleavage/methylation domain-containing protein
MTRPTNGRHRRRGYTVVEIMIALTLLGIGTTGIIAMQKVTTVGNRDAKNLVIANQVARTWLERLRTDAVQWNHPSPVNAVADLNDTKWLDHVDGTWFRPAEDATTTPVRAAAADALGNDVSDANIDSATNGAIFCTNVRLTWLYGAPPTVPPPYLVRAEVRVFWLRDGAGGSLQAYKNICDPAITPAEVSPAVDRLHFVYIASAITQNMAQ